MPALIDRTGHRYGLFTVIARGPDCQWPNSRPTPAWLCRCDCGTEKVIPAVNLTSGRAQSCGCRSLELKREKLRRHGKTRTREHTIWIGMHQRCENPNNRAYRNYGGRGITVCARWSVFENFLADMGEAPAGASIDRIDNDGPYAPYNCRWATRIEQGRNRSVNRVVSLNGEQITLAELAERTGIPYRRLCWRAQQGYTGEQLTAPKKRNQWG